MQTSKGGPGERAGSGFCLPGSEGTGETGVMDAAFCHQSVDPPG